MKQKLTPWIALTLVILTSPWWWKATQSNLVLSILLLTTSALLVYLFLIKYSKKLTIVAAIIYLAIFLLIAASQGFDQSILSKSDLDIQKYNNRSHYFAKDLGKVYGNKFSIYFYKNIYFPLEKLQDNFFSNLDINLYFFASHPRERTGFSEFEKYSFLTLPLFLVGVFFFLTKKSWQLLTLLLIISVISSLLSPKYTLGPVLSFPVINLILTAGLVWFVTKLKNVKQ